MLRLSVKRPVSYCQSVCLCYLSSVPDLLPGDPTREAGDGGGSQVILIPYGRWLFTLAIMDICGVNQQKGSSSSFPPPPLFTLPFKKHSRRNRMRVHFSKSTSFFQNMHFPQVFFEDPFVLIHTYPFFLLVCFYQKFWMGLFTKCGLFYGKNSEKEEKTERKKSLSTNLLSTWLGHPELGQAKAKSFELQPGLPRGAQGPEFGPFSAEFPRCFRKH